MRAVLATCCGVPPGFSRTEPAPDLVTQAEQCPTRPAEFRLHGPPLWSADSVDNGAGIAWASGRQTSSHYMPHETDLTSPRLFAEKAWYVTAFMLSHERPAKPGLKRRRI
ncbi:MAG TPA: hypothetical protein VGO06_23820 [Bosea sp. (in: a-proteobacteria)]|jgi:hypothetical protein|uniref:hypothetical protein n=1 Tax=Bosea sp. (in: a-proteobacteria) TaxID=1871050 RepID=UPI002E12C02E|nr:hypothetical protein [Bosea sp. (in: a-proteobacteria)]